MGCVCYGSANYHIILDLSDHIVEVQCERRILGDQSKSGWNPFPTHWNDVQGVGGCVLKHILQLLIGNHVLGVCTPPFGSWRW